MEFLEEVMESEIFDWFYFLSLALILAFGTITTTGTALSTDKPVVSVVSCSMYPEYHKGDIIMVQGEKFEDIETGDVLVYGVPDRVDFTVNGESYTLEENSPLHNTSVETSVGSVKLVEVASNLNVGQGQAVVSIDGEKTTVGEGDDLTVKGSQLSFERISSMPIPVVHRVVEKSENSLQTKGDANAQQLDFEKDVRPFQIHGTSMFTIPRLGAVKILAMDFVGFQGDKPFVFDVYSPCR
jgi:signal peptidase I